MAFIRILTLFLPLSLFAGGAQLTELGTPALGLAGVGQAAEASNASTAYYNPAGMPHLCCDEVLVGGQGVAVWGKGKTTLAPGIGAYWVHQFSECASFGVSINAPYLLKGAYKPSFVQSSSVDVAFLAVDLNPSVAFQLADWVSVGGGLVLEYTQFHVDFVVQEPQFQWNMRAHRWRTGYNLGILFSLGGFTRLGVTYRSELSSRISKKKDFTPFAGMAIIEHQIPLPQNIVVSVYHQLTPCFALLADVGWAHYRMYNHVVTLNEIVNVIRAGEHFKNVWHGGVGAQYRLCPGWVLQSGLMYGESPLKENSEIKLPIEGQWRVAGGVIYELGCYTFSSNVEYIWMGMEGLFFNLTFSRRF